MLPILGRVPQGVSRPQVKLMGALGLALLFENYDVATLANATKYIRESFGLPQSEVGRMLAWVRAGALPAVLIVPFADRIGRRQLFLFCVAGSSLGAFATAFTQTLPQFLAAQMVVRSCLVAGGAAAFVIAAEEFPAQHRGWAIGILGALGALGYGLSAGLFSAINVLPYGWRALYAAGALPLLLLPYFGRRVGETERFRQQRSVNATGRKSRAAASFAPSRRSSRHYPLRISAIASIATFASMGQAVAHGPIADHLQTDRGFSPQLYSTMVIAGGAIGIAGNTVFGRLADRVGRRALGVVVLVVFPFLAAAVFHLESVVVDRAGLDRARVRHDRREHADPRAGRGAVPHRLAQHGGGVGHLFETIGAVLGLYLVTAFTPAGQGIAGAVQGIVFVDLAGRDDACMCCRRRPP